MKNLLLFLFSIMCSVPFFAQERQVIAPYPSPFQKTEIKIGITDVSLEYCRPSMRGRKIFGGLEAYGAIWRTGANINTRIEFKDAVIIGDYTLAAGAYTLFTRPNANQWEIYFHTELNEYGAPEVLDQKNIKAQLKVTPIALTRPIETLAITFDNLTDNSAILAIAWEQTYIPIPIKVATDQILEKRFAAERENLYDDYRAAANIYFNVEKDSEKALVAINHAIDLVQNGKPFETWLETADLSNRHLPNKHRLKSVILADLGKKEEAIKYAEMSLRIARLVEDDFYIQANLKNLEEWK